MLAEVFTPPLFRRWLNTQQSHRMHTGWNWLAAYLQAMSPVTPDGPLFVYGITQNNVVCYPHRSGSFVVFEPPVWASAFSGHWGDVDFYAEYAVDEAITRLDTIMATVSPVR